MFNETVYQDAPLVPGRRLGYNAPVMPGRRLGIARRGGGLSDLGCCGCPEKDQGGLSNLPHWIVYAALAIGTFIALKKR